MANRLILIAIAIIILIVLGVLGPSSFLLLLSPQPELALGASIVYSCIDSKQCRESVYPALQGYSVSPKSQSTSAYFCTRPAVKITVHNPLQSSDVKVSQNDQEIGEIGRGGTKEFYIMLNPLNPKFRVGEITETRTVAVDSEYVRGDLFGDVLDKGKRMGETISVIIDWKPSENQSRASNQIAELNNTISICSAKASEKNATQLSPTLNSANETLKRVISDFENCDFTGAEYRAKSQNILLQDECNTALPKSFWEQLVDYWWLVLIILLIIYAYFSSRDNYPRY